MLIYNCQIVYKVVMTNLLPSVKVMRRWRMMLASIIGFFLLINVLITVYL